MTDCGHDWDNSLELVAPRHKGHAALVKIPRPDPISSVMIEAEVEDSLLNQGVTNSQADYGCIRVQLSVQGAGLSCVDKFVEVFAMVGALS